MTLFKSTSVLIMWTFENFGVGFILVLLCVFKLYTMCMLCEILSIWRESEIILFYGSGIVVTYSANLSS